MDFDNFINEYEYSENVNENFGVADVAPRDNASKVAAAVLVVERNGYFVTQN